MSPATRASYTRRAENTTLTHRVVDVRRHENGVAHVSEPRHLKASHIKPWRDATDAERPDGANGLLLSPHIDHLFDEGYLTFSSSQELVIVPEVRDKLLDAWGIDVGGGPSAPSRESRTPTWTTTARTCSSACLE